MRACPVCKARCILHKAEALEDEDERMKALSRRLADIPPSAPDLMLDEAREIIRQLNALNMRWNITELDDFITQRQRELGIGMRRK